MVSNKMESNIEYYVNPEKGVVVARLPNVAQELYEEAVHIWNQKMTEELGEAIIYYQVMEPVVKWINKNKNAMNSLTGKSKCNFEKGDVFDEKFGKELATARLIEKISKYRTNFYVDITRSTHNLANVFLARAKGNNQKMLNAIQRQRYYLENEPS